jgi:hypothetical protein
LVLVVLRTGGMRSVLLVLMLLGYTEARAQQQIAADTVWRLADSPISLVGVVEVMEGATLTIEPGVVVEAAFDAALTVRGDVLIDGGIERPVSFVSTAHRPAGGDWQGLRLISPGPDTRLNGLDVRHAVECLALEHSEVRVAHARLVDCSAAGLVIDGGRVTIADVHIERAAVGLLGPAGGVHVVEQRGVRPSLVIDDVAGVGALLVGGHWELRDCLIHHAGDSGIELFADDVWLTLDHCIVAHNGRHGVTSENFRAAVEIVSSALTDNVQPAVELRAYTCRDSNATGPSSEWFAEHESCFSAQPLYVDGPNGDYTPTSRSPHRGRGTDGGLVGPFPFQGAPTAGLTGHLWEDLHLRAGDGPHRLHGTLVVAGGATLTVDSGVELRLDDPNQFPFDHSTVLRALPGTTVRIGADAGPPVRVVSSAGVGGRWYFADTAGELLGVHLSSGEIHISGPSTPRLEQLILLNTEIRVEDVPTAQPLVVNRMDLKGRGTGLLAYNASARISNTSFQGFRVGLRVEETAEGWAHVVVSHCTFYNNSEAMLLNSLGFDDDDARLDVIDTVIADSRLRHAWGTGQSTWRNVLVSPGDRGRVPVVAQVLEADPGFVEPDERLGQNLCPRRGSPLIDAGRADPDDLAEDQRGRPRSVGAAPDIGACEFDPLENLRPVAVVAPLERTLTGDADPRFVLDARASFDPDGDIVDAWWTTYQFGKATRHPGALVFAQRVFEGDDAVLSLLDDAGAETRYVVELPRWSRISAGSPQVVDTLDVTFRGVGLIGLAQWDPGDGSPMIVGASPTHRYPGPGEYVARLLVTTAAGVQFEDWVRISILGDGASTGPLISSGRLTGVAQSGHPVTIGAEVRDTDGVEAARLEYRVGAGPEWGSVQMQPVGENGSYAAEVPADAVREPYLAWRVVARDTQGFETRMPMADPDGFRRYPVADDRTAPSIYAIPHRATFFTVRDRHNLLAEVSLWCRRLGDDAFVQGVVSHLSTGPYGRLVSGSMGARAPDFGGVHAIECYYRATDLAGNIGYAPPEGPDGPWAVEAFEDVRPTIELEPILEPVFVGDDLVVRGRASDVSGIAQVGLIARDGPDGHEYLARLLDDEVFEILVPGEEITASSSRSDLRMYVTARSRVARESTASVNVEVRVHPADDGDPPIIVHAALGSAVVTAGISDPSGIVRKEVVFRNPHDVMWQRVPMLQFGGLLEQARAHLAVRSPGIEYYIEAADGVVPPNIARHPVEGFHYVFHGAVWVPRILHDPLDVVTVDQPLTLAVRIVASAPIEEAMVWIAVDDGAPVSLPLETEEGVAWRAGPWPVPQGAQRLVYWFTVRDALGQTSSLPAGGEGAPFEARVGMPHEADQLSPMMVHEVPEAVEGSPLVLRASASDEGGAVRVDAWLEVGGVSVVVPSVQGVGDLFEMRVPATLIHAPELRYRLRAVDPTGNTTWSPPEAEQQHVAVVRGLQDAAAPLVRASAPQVVEAGAVVPVQVEARDESGLAGVVLFVDRPEAEPLPVVLDADGASRWSGLVPAEWVHPPSVAFWVIAEDAAGNEGRWPEAGWSEVVVAEPRDVSPPVVAHVPVEWAERGVPMRLTMEVVDDRSVISVDVFVRMPGAGVPVRIGGTLIEGDQWRADVPVFDFDGFEYWLVASDGTSLTTVPAGAPEETYSVSYAVASPGGRQKRLGWGAAAADSGLPVPSDSVEGRPPSGCSVRASERGHGCLPLMLLLLFVLRRSQHPAREV